MLALLLIAIAIGFCILYLLWQGATGALAYRPEEMAEWSAGREQPSLLLNRGSSLSDSGRSAYRRHYSSAR